MWFQPIRDWRERHPTLSALARSLTVGIAVLIFLAVLQPPMLTIVRKEADETADKMIRLSESTATELRRSPGYTFVTIDDKAWSAWKSPLITPREQVTALLARVVRSQPLAVILDVNLAFPGTPAGEQALSDFFDGYRPDWPPLLLVRSLIAPPEGSHSLPDQRVTAYDAKVKAHPNIAWAIPLFERDSDGTVRRWRLVVPTCVDGKSDVLPSTHLAAAVLVRDANTAADAPSTGDTRPTAWAELSRRMAVFADPGCVIPERATTKPPATVLADATPTAPPIVVDRDDVSSRVLYSVGWSRDAVALGPWIDTAHGRTQLVAVRPALAVLGVPADASVPGLAGRVVLIGGSFGESDDWHQTPLGRMPGALMLLNAIDALARIGTPTEPGIAERAGISLLIIVVVCLLTTFFRPAVAALGASVAISLVMIISLRHFRSGVVLDLAVPAVAAALYDFGEAQVEKARSIWQHGWRWIFKA